MLSNQSINNISYYEILDGLNSNGKVSFDIFFYAENKTVNLLHTVIGKKENKFIVLDEFLKSKPSFKVKNKNAIFDFEGCEALLTRNNDEAFLLDDVSIMVAFNKKSKDTLVVRTIFRIL